MRNVVALVAVSAVALVALGCQKKKAHHDATEQAEDKKPVAATAKADADKLGITDDEIVLGMSSSFQGPAAEIGIECYRGAVAYFAEINAAGGVNGRTIRIAPLDDSYDGAKAAANTDSLIGDGKAFIMFSAGGTSNTNGIVRSLLAKKDSGAFLFGSTSGAQTSREPPGSAVAFHVRTSINETTRAAIETFLAAGRTKIGVFAQDDEFGQAIIDGAKLAGAELKANVVATAKQPKGQKFEVSTAEQVKALKSAGADAVILGANYQPEAAFIRDSVDDKWNVAYAVMTGESTLLRTLKQHEAKTNKSYTQSPTVAPIAVPDVDDTTYPAVIEYRALMDKRNPKVPDEVRDANYKLTQYNGRSLEGFIEAKILVEALRRAGRDLTRAKLRAAIESIRDWDVGLRAPVTYGPNDNQGLDRVFLLGLRAGKWEPVEDAKSFLKSTSGAASTAAVAAAKPHK